MKCIYKDNKRLMLEANLRFLGCVFGAILFLLAPLAVFSVIGLLAAPLFLGLSLFCTFYISKIRYLYTVDKTNNQFLVESLKPFAKPKVLIDEKIGAIQSVGVHYKYDEEMPNSKGHDANVENMVQNFGPRTVNYQPANRAKYCIQIRFADGRVVNLNQVTTSNGALVAQTAKQLADFLGVPLG